MIGAQGSEAQKSMSREYAVKMVMAGIMRMYCGIKKAEIWSALPVAEYT